MMVSEAAPNEVVLDFAEGISQVHQNSKISSVGFFRISHHEVQQFSVFQDSILAMSKAFLDVVVTIFIDIQKRLQPIPNKR